MVSCKDVIGIFDIQTKDSATTQAFLHAAQTRETVEVGEIKSFVVTDGKMYYSPISSLTLKRRARFMDWNTRTDHDS